MVWGHWSVVMPPLFYTWVVVSTVRVRLVPEQVPGNRRKGQGGAGHTWWVVRRTGGWEEEGVGMGPQKAGWGKGHTWALSSDGARPGSSLPQQMLRQVMGRVGAALGVAMTVSQRSPLSPPGRVAWQDSGDTRPTWGSGPWGRQDWILLASFPAVVEERRVHPQLDTSRPTQRSPPAPGAACAGIAQAKSAPCPRPV